MSVYYKVTTKKTPSQPAGLTKVFTECPGRKPTLAEIHAWLKKEHGINSVAGDSGFEFEKV